MSQYELVPKHIKLIINCRKFFEIMRLSVDLDIYSKMERPVTVEHLSNEIEIDEQFTEYLLKVLYKFGFVDCITSGKDLLYVNSNISRQYLDSRSMMYLGKELFDDIETGAILQKYVTQGPASRDITKDYWSGEVLNKIASVSLLGGLQIAVKKIDLSGHSRLLDVGGGHGLYSIFFTKKYPNLKASVLDYPEVTEITKEFVNKYSAHEQVKVIAGDYKNFKPQQRFDVVFISNVTTSYNDLLELLAKSKNWLTAGGLLIIRNFVTDVDVDVWSSLNTLERYARRGKKGITSKQAEAALQRNGFTDIKRLCEGEGIIILQGLKNKNS